MLFKKISRKWGEKPHFRLIFGRSGRIRTDGIEVPNFARYQLRHTPMGEKYSVFSVKSVSGQICGQKYFAEHEYGGKARKHEKNGDFASFRRSAHEAVTRSQSKRVTVTLHPDIRFWGLNP